MAFNAAELGASCWKSLALFLSCATLTRGLTIADRSGGGLVRFGEVVRFEEAERLRLAQAEQYFALANLGFDDLYSSLEHMRWIAHKDDVKDDDVPASAGSTGAFGFSDRLEGKVSSSQLPWRPIPKLLNDASKSLCDSGRLLPQLYILGAAKAATTSLAADLQGAGVDTVGLDCRISQVDMCGADGNLVDSNKKEFHFFDFSMNWERWSPDQFDEMVEDVRPKWLRTLPACPTDKQKVVADYTPESLRLVPLPDGSHPVGNFVGKGFLPWQLSRNYTASTKVHLPRVLHSLYPAQQAPRVTFVVMLREPASRMQSHWYCCVCPKPTRVEGGRCEGRTFEGDMTFTMAHASQGIYNDWLWYSLYDAHLTEWFQVWEPSNFYIVPYKQFTKGNKDVICQDLAHRMDYPIECQSGGTAATWIGADPHGKPDVQQDLSEELWSSYEQFITPGKERLVSIIAAAHLKGAGLANYEGAPGSATEVKSWLFSAW